MVPPIVMSVVLAVVMAYVLQQSGIDRFLGIAGITAVLCVAQLAYWWMVR